jgi:hypothetical protein
VAPCRQACIRNVHTNPHSLKESASIAGVIAGSIADRCHRHTTSVPRCSEIKSTWWSATRRWLRKRQRDLAETRRKGGKGRENPMNSLTLTIASGQALSHRGAPAILKQSPFPRPDTHRCQPVTRGRPSEKDEWPPFRSAKSDVVGILHDLRDNYQPRPTIMSHIN